jgi:hypothetical protein
MKKLTPKLTPVNTCLFSVRRVGPISAMITDAKSDLIRNIVCEATRDLLDR